MFPAGNSFNGSSAYADQGNSRTEPFWFHQMGYKTLGEDRM
jgi:hypothetical protein